MMAAGTRTEAASKPPATRARPLPLPLRRSYGDWIVASGPAAASTRAWLAPLPGIEVRRWSAPRLEITLRGTTDFFARHVALDACGTTLVAVIGTPFERTTLHALRPEWFLSRALDGALAAALWGQFTVLRADLHRGAVEWLVDLERSLSPWWTETSGTRVALRFAPAPSRTGARLDPEGAGEFLLHGIVGGTGTPVRGWNLLPAGAWEKWEGGRRLAGGAAAHPVHAGPQGHDDAYASFAARLEATLAGATTGFEAALLPLTGGIDSRLLFAALLHAGLPASCYTHGTPGCADQRTVEAYQRHVTFTHRFHAVPPDSWLEFPERVRTGLAMLGPDYDFLAYPHLLTSYAAEEPAGRLFLSGVGTGLHKIPYLPQTALDASPVPAIDAVVRHYGRLDNATLLHPAVAAAAIERMRTAIAAVLAECPPGTRRVHQVQYYHLQERLGRWAGKGMQLQDLCGYDLCYPFLEPELMRESRRLGYARLHFGQKIIRALQHLEPRLLAVDNANGWPVVPMTPGALARRLPAYARGLGRYLHRKRSGYVAANIAIVDYRRVWRTAYRDLAHELLAPGRSHLEDTVRPEALRATLDALEAGSPPVKRLGALAALEMWCRS